jgi:hypothetical protein
MTKKGTTKCNSNILDAFDNVINRNMQKLTMYLQNMLDRQRGAQLIIQRVFSFSSTAFSIRFSP